MTSITQSLRDEHQDLMPNVEFLRSAADMVGEVPLETLRHEVAQAREFLAGTLVPHAEAEDAALYPTVSQLIGSEEAIAIMKRDHVEIAHLTEELNLIYQRLGGMSLAPAQARALRRILYGLHTLVKVHMHKEEAILFPLLDRYLSVEEAQRMLKSMEQTAEDTRHHHHLA